MNKGKKYSYITDYPTGRTKKTTVKWNDITKKWDIIETFSQS